MLTFSSCASCPKHTPLIMPDVPENYSDVMVLGEGPGKTEIAKGRPFCGDSGSELDSLYLRLAGLRRADVWVSNVTLCGFPAQGIVDRKNPYRNPTRSEASDCAKSHLAIELSILKPRVVVALGALACSIWRDEHGNLSPIALSRQHGIPQWKRYGGWEGWVYPVYHPAAGMRQSLFMRMMVLDWAWLGQLLRHGFNPHPPLPAPNYFRAQTPAQVAAYLHANREWTRAYGFGLDTEQDEDTRGLPYCVTVSANTESGMLVKASDTLALGELWRWWHSTKHLAVFHNKLHDAPVVARMGGPKPYSYPWEDTIIKASVLQLPSIGLKPLAGRYLGMDMLDYDETVTPPSLLAFLEWAECAVMAYELDHMHAHTFKSGQRKGQTELRVRTGTDKMLKSGVTLVRNALKTGQELIAQGREMGMLPYEEDEASGWAWKGAGDNDEDLAPPMTKCVNRVKGWDKDKLEAVEHMTGMKAPRRSIIHVPDAQLLPYACGDSLATIRLRPVMDGLLKGFRESVEGGRFE